jgi:hypothetical protein
VGTTAGHVVYEMFEKQVQHFWALSTLQWSPNISYVLYSHGVAACALMVRYRQEHVLWPNQVTKVVVGPYHANGDQCTCVLLERCGVALDVVLEMQERDLSIQCQCKIFQLYMFIYICWNLFCNVWMCVCVGVCMCGFCNVWVCVICVMCGCVYVWVL